MARLIIAALMAYGLQLLLVEGVALGIAIIVGLATGASIPYVAIAIVVAIIYVVYLVYRIVMTYLAIKGLQDMADKLDDHLDL